MPDYKRLAGLLLALWFGSIGFGQTCCSGGVPLAAGLGLPPQAGGTLQLQVNYDLNLLRTLKTGRETLDDDSRTRRTHSTLLQADYSLSQRLAVETLLSWVRQERTIRQFGSRNETHTQGIGDAVLLVKYQLWSTPDQGTQVTAALGVKAPFGAADRRREDGLLINADLQPGSGAWDGIGWLRGLYTTTWRPTLSLSATAVYAYKGRNNNYLGEETYRFGQEWQLRLQLADRFFVNRAILDPILGLRYRRAGADELNAQAVPSTGGEWVFLNAGLSYWLRPDLAFTSRAELPLYARIVGTQVSPSLRLNFGVFALLDFSQPSFITP